MSPQERLAQKIAKAVSDQDIYCTRSEDSWEEFIYYLVLEYTRQLDSKFCPEGLIVVD